MSSKSKRDSDGNVVGAVRQQTVKETYDATFRGFINLSLSEEQKEKFPAWFESSSFWEAFEAFSADGVGFSCKRDPRSDGYLASATQRRTGSINAGLVVTARAGDAAKALGRVVFSVLVLSHKERWEDTQPVADPDRW